MDTDRTSLQTHAMTTGPDRPRIGVVAIDIETDTTPCHEPAQACCTGRGLDPAITTITAVAISDENGETVLDAEAMGSESALIQELDRILMSKTGLLFTWNGAVFDIPFIADRAKLLEIQIGLTTSPAPWATVKYRPIPGHEGGYSAGWGTLQHVDVMTWYQQSAIDHGVGWSLKPISTLYGLEPVIVDRAAMHELTAGELEAYVASDARVTRQLGLMALLPT